MSMTFVPLGGGDAFSARYYSSCLFVEAEGKGLLVDCPHPIRKMMAEAGESAGRRIDLDLVEAVALTHLHADHSSGLEGFGYASHYVLGRRATLIAHPAVTERLWEGHLAAGMESLMPGPGETASRRECSDYFDLLPVREEAPAEIGPFRIECRRTIHHIPTTAFRIHAAGRVLGVSADTAFDPELIDWLMEADVVVHETNYGVHTPYEKLAALSELRRRKMKLIHYPDDFDPETSCIEALRQGVVYRI